MGETPEYTDYHRICGSLIWFTWSNFEWEKNVIFAQYKKLINWIIEKIFLF